jgi:hypothetical protein
MDAKCTTKDCNNSIEKGGLVCVDCATAIRLDKEKKRDENNNHLTQSTVNVKELTRLYSLIESEKDELLLEIDSLRSKNVNLEEKLHKMKLDYDQLQLDLEKAIIDTKREILSHGDQPIQGDQPERVEPPERVDMEVSLNFPPSFKESVIQTLSNRDSVVKKKAFLARGERK